MLRLSIIHLSLPASYTLDIVPLLSTWEVEEMPASNHPRTQEHQVTESRDTGITGKEVEGMKLEGTVKRESSM